MLFGEPSDFAVEIYHEPSSPDWIGYGRMCIFIQGIVIGKIEAEHCSLFHAVQRIGEVAESLSSLWDTRFTQHTDEEIFSWLDAVLYSGEISDDVENNFHRFDFLTNRGEQFDDSKTFVLCFPADVVRILIFKDQKFSLASCQVKTFLLVATTLGRWFNEQTIGRLYS